ncbi:unnamed protein product, partial [Ectocarpus sp. 13 AM-2016]
WRSSDINFRGGGGGGVKLSCGQRRVAAKAVVNCRSTPYAAVMFAQPRRSHSVLQPCIAFFTAAPHLFARLFTSLAPPLLYVYNLTPCLPHSENRKERQNKKHVLLPPNVHGIPK